MKTIEKYAPSDLSEVIFGSENSLYLVNAIAQGAFDCHVLLHGPNGTGKTTTAELLAHAIGGEDALIETKDFNTVLAMPDLKEYLQRCASLARLTAAGYLKHGGKSHPTRIGAGAVGGLSGIAVRCYIFDGDVIGIDETAFTQAESLTDI